MPSQIAKSNLASSYSNVTARGVSGRAPNRRETSAWPIEAADQGALDPVGGRGSRLSGSVERTSNRREGQGKAMQEDEQTEANQVGVGPRRDSGERLVGVSDADGQKPEGLRRLDSILRSLPETELSSLVTRVGIKVDDQKRIDVASQVARALVGLPEVRDPSRLPAQSQELLHRVAEANGVLLVKSVPAGIEPLVARGLLFARRIAEHYQLVLPTAFLVQLPSWQNEDPRSLRALLAQAPFETVSAIASHYLGRPATPPIALALEAAWETIMDPTALRGEIERLPLAERRLLEAIESGGGEVETPELLDLEREPMRLRSAKGVSASRRGAGFALERRALLIPIHPNRHIVPSEVAELVGSERKRSSESRRSNIRAHVLGEDHAPRRARFARDPSGLALALAIAARESAAEVRPHVGTPRSLVVRLAQRFGRSNATTSLFASLSRATGLWEPSALSAASPPGSLTVGDVGALLFSAWRRGGAWDEARPEPEVLRAAPDQRDASPSRALREVVLEALAELGEDSWLPWSALESYLKADPRFESLGRLFRRWADRVGISAPPEPLDVARRMVLESLPVLGVVDLGAETDVTLERSGGSSDAFAPSEITSLTLRLTSRGRSWMASPDSDEATAAGARSASGSVRPPSSEAPPPSSGKSASMKALAVSKFTDTHVLRIGAAATTAAVLALGFYAEIGRVEDGLDLVFSPAAIARAISGGAAGDEIRDRIEAVASLPETLSQTLIQASAVIGKASFATAGGFLWIDNPDVREMLRTRKPTADLFLDPSPPGGLLVAPDVDHDRLVRRCRGLGVEIEGGLATPRAGSTSVRAASERAMPRVKTTPPTRSRTPFPRSR